MADEAGKIAEALYEAHAGIGYAEGRHHAIQEAQLRALKEGTRFSYEWLKGVIDGAAEVLRIANGADQ